MNKIIRLFLIVICGKNYHKLLSKPTPRESVLRRVASETTLFFWRKIRLVNYKIVIFLAIPSSVYASDDIADDGRRAVSQAGRVSIVNSATTLTDRTRPAITIDLEQEKHKRKTLANYSIDRVIYEKEQKLEKDSKSGGFFDVYYKSRDKMLSGEYDIFDDSDTEVKSRINLYDDEFYNDKEGNLVNRKSRYNQGISKYDLIDKGGD
ncbi:MAG: hypothetical protein R3D71_06460 [Rickettsiales bacterium]